jgi:hypothetical protein
MYHTNIPFLILKLDAAVKSLKTHATLGNPTDVDEDGLLMDIDVQQVHDDVPTALGDRRWDIDHFFNPPILKTVNGHVKKYCGCKLCPYVHRLIPLALCSLANETLPLERKKILSMKLQPYVGIWRRIIQ